MAWALRDTAWHPQGKQNKFLLSIFPREVWLYTHAHGCTYCCLHVGSFSGVLAKIPVAFPQPSRAMLFGTLVTNLPRDLHLCLLSLPSVPPFQRQKAGLLLVCGQVWTAPPRLQHQREGWRALPQHSEPIDTTTPRKPRNSARLQCSQHPWPQDSSFWWQLEWWGPLRPGHGHHPLPKAYWPRTIVNSKEKMA